MLRHPMPIDTVPKFKNKNKDYEYHEDQGHTTTECRELKKALHELANRGQLNCFLKKGEDGDHNRCNREGKKDNDADRNTKIIATIIRGIDGKELSIGYQKAQIWKLSKDMVARN